jgi:adenosylmethionine-8-amino-7-oxononanoate aminotransferase
VSHIFHRDFDRTLPTAVAGEGCYLIDAEGRRYLDASGGAAVSCLGHGHPAVSEAIKAQLDRIAYAHTGFFTSEPAERLAEKLVGGAPGDLDCVLFVAGGSEAVEAALKLARQYFVETGEPARHAVISRRQSYHGNTLGALSVSGNEARRALYRPFLFDATQIAPCYPYRDRAPEETDEAYGLRVADELEAEIRRLGPTTVAAFVAETVTGATLGAQPAVPGYFARIREICDRYGVLLILDEVMSGMGRTGTRYACEQEGIAPDIVTCAKGLGGGYQPIGAVVASRRIADAIAQGSGALRHGHTYMAHPVACAAALAVQETIEAENLLDNVRRQGEALADALTERFGNHHHVGDIRGRGLFAALELVRDRTTKEPFDPTTGLAARIKRAGMEAGLICYPSSGTIDGRRGDHVLLAPPYIVGPNEIEEMVDKLDGALARAVAEAVAASA